MSASTNRPRWTSSQLDAVVLLAGDGRFCQVINRNDGITNSDYFDRDRFRAAFQDIFDHLRSLKLFEQSRTAIENGGVFGGSPFKALTADQEEAVASIVGALLNDLSGGSKTTSVVSGGPGTGKTIIGILLMNSCRTSPPVARMRPQTLRQHCPNSSPMIDAYSSKISASDLSFLSNP